MLETKLLAPHLGARAPSQFAPNVQLTSGEQGSTSDLETRIDQQAVKIPESSDPGSELKALLQTNAIRASLLVQSSEAQQSGVFVRIHSAVVLENSSEWKDSDVRSAVTAFVAPSMSASGLGLHWLPNSGYQQVDGLWPLFFSVRGKYLLVSDDAALMQDMLARSQQQSNRKPMQRFAGFNHKRERQNFSRLADLVDRPGAPAYGNSEHRVEFFSGDIASLSNTLADISSEEIEVRSEGNKVRETVSYRWSH